MGLFISKLYTLFEGFGGGQEAKIVMLGLDAAGKTTILYKVKLNENISSIPTIGFNVETVQPTKGVSFTVWDVGGQEKIRRLWYHYYRDVQGLIFVVDSSDKNRMKEAGEELAGILNADEMRGVPFVVIANKQDLPGALRPSDLIKELSLREYRDRKWHVQGACAVNGEGIYESMEQLSVFVKEYKKTGGGYH